MSDCFVLFFFRLLYNDVFNIMNLCHSLIVLKIFFKLFKAITVTSVLKHSELSCCLLST